MGGSTAPQYQPPDDKSVVSAAESQAEQDRVRALTERARGDTASVLARYGSRLALAGSQSGTASGASPGATQNPLLALMTQVFKSRGVA